MTPKEMQDLIMSTYFDQLRMQGYNQIAKNCEAIYEEQQAVKEAEQIIREVKP